MLWGSELGAPDISMVPVSYTHLTLVRTDQLIGTLPADLQGDLQDDMEAPERTRFNKLDSETSDHSEPPDQPEADGSGSVLTLNLPSPKALWPNLHSQPKLEKGRS